MRKLKSDAVKTVRVIFSGSHEAMKAMEQSSHYLEAWKRTNYEKQQKMTEGLTALLGRCKVVVKKPSMGKGWNDMSEFVML